MGKKKILHLITGLEIGGAEMMLLKTLPLLQKDFDNRVCCIRGRGPMGERLEASGVPVYYLDLESFFDYTVIGKFKHLLMEFTPDLLVTYLIHADLFGRILGRIFHIPKIICSVRAKLIEPKYLPFLLLDGLTSSLVNHYHFNSQSVAILYQKYFFLPPEKCTVIPNGLDLSLYGDIPQERILTLKKSLGLEGKTVISCLAKLRAQKGHEYLLTAFCNLQKTHPDTRLLLIGDGAEKEKLQMLAAKLGITHTTLFLGNRDDVPLLLAATDIFVFPTLFEGMSNALMEAMASGLPIVATNIPENQELITSGKTGLLVSTRESKALVEATRKLLADSPYRIALKKAAFDAASSRFNLTNTVRQYRELFARFL